jgi:hypothetical protein
MVWSSKARQTILGPLIAKLSLKKMILGFKISLDLNAVAGTAIPQPAALPTTNDGFIHTTPLRNSSSGYFVPRQVTPSLRKVRTMERISVYSNIIVLMGCSRK